MNACPICGQQLEEGPYHGELAESSEWCEAGHYRYETLCGWITYIIGKREITYAPSDPHPRPQIEAAFAAEKLRWRRWRWARKAFWRSMAAIDNFLHWALAPFRGDGPLEKFEFAFCQWAIIHYSRQVPEDWRPKKPDPGLAEALR